MILKENEVLRCPRCGGKTFCATAHVTQDWELDDSGTFVRCLNDCIEVTHEPDREDIWDCKTCGYSDAGEKFVTTVGEAARSAFVSASMTSLRWRRRCSARTAQKSTAAICSTTF